MSSRLRSAGLIGIGLIAGVSITYGVTAYAVHEATSPIPLEEIREFTDVFGAIKANYVEQVDDKKLIEEAIAGMLSGLDPHSAFLDGENYRDLQIGTQGEFGGLGIEVGVEEGVIKVIAPIDDTPAARAGIRAGDLIIKIDDKLTRGMTLVDAIKLMRGKPQTPIVLTIARKGETQPLDIHIMRDVIHVQSVKSHMIEPGYGYIRISQFQERTTEDLVKQVVALYKDGPLKGLVLDLRNDPGGVLNGAVGVSAVFLPPDSTVVTTEGRTEDAHRRFAAIPADYLRGPDDPLIHLPADIKKVPLVVLVNGASASASEIVAGALQDLKRAELIGTQTFGKGSVQSVIQVRNDHGDNPAAIKLTTARYFTPSGKSIQAKGITPDLMVDDTPEGNFSAWNVREADLANHLSNPTNPDVNKPTDTAVKPAAEPAKPDPAAVKAKRYEFGAADDFQLKQAMNFLKGQPVEVAKPAADAKPASDVKPAPDVKDKH